MFEIFSRLFDTSGFPPRWHCGEWSSELGWLHILSDLGIWSAYFAIPALLLYFTWTRKDLPFRTIFLLFGAFILFCGLTHLMDAAIFYWPAYRLSAVLKLATAAISWGTVLALAPIIPQALALRSSEELEQEIAERKRAEEKLLAFQHELEERVAARTSELVAANAALQRSEEHLRLALDAGRMGTWDWTIATGKLAWTGHLEEIHGFNSGTFDGMFQSFVQVVHPEDQPRLQATIERTLAEGGGFEAEFRVVWPDGSLHWIAGKGGVVLGSDAQPVRMIGVGMDITGRKEAENAAHFLAEASAALASLIDYESTLQKLASLAVPQFADWCTIDMLEEDGALRRLVVAHVDPAKVRLARELEERYPSDRNSPRGVWQVLRTGVSDMMEDIPPELLDAAAVDDEHRRVMHDLGLRSYVCVPLKLRGRIFGAITFVAAESGRRYTARDLTLAEDLANRAGVAIENARLYGDLREADRRKDEFLAMLAHELRNPLAPIGNALQIMRLAPDNHEAVATAQGTMERQFEHLVRLVDDLLDVSRIMRGKIDLRLEKCTIAALVERAVESARPLITARRHRLRIDLPNEGAELVADPVRLTQVIANLLNNAAKYTPEEGEIVLTAFCAGDEFRVSVRDNGIGISADSLPRVFDMFVQAREGLVHSQGGLGLGLTLVKSLVQLHGGRVEARSEGAGLGAEFLVHLPLLCSLSLDGTAPRSGAQITARRMLVVDDNIDSASTLAFLLRSQHHQVMVANDGYTALEMAAEFAPDIAVLDIGMPGMDGHELAQRLREQFPDRKLQLVALTGWGGAEDRERTRQAGFDYHLVKPIRLEDLAEIIGRNGNQ